MRKTMINFVALALAGLFATPATSFAAHASPRSLLGTPVHNGVPDYHPEPQEADRTIIIGNDTRYVNVTGGETVNFVVGDKSFEWLFDTYEASRVFDLKEIAPAGILGNQDVKVYLAPDSLYQ